MRRLISILSLPGRSLARVVVRLFSSFSFCLHITYRTAHFTLPTTHQNIPSHLITSFLEMSAFMGGDSTPNGLRFQFTDRFKPVAKRQETLRADGADPSGVDIDPRSAKKGGQQHITFHSVCSIAHCTCTLPITHLSSI